MQRTIRGAIRLSCGLAAVRVPSPKLLERGSPLIRDPLCGMCDAWSPDRVTRDLVSTAEKDFMQLRDQLMSVLSFSAGIARIVALSIPQFWLVMLLAYATGDRIDESLWLSASVVILVLCAGVTGLLFSLRYPQTRARMRVGPRAFADWRLAVLTAGSASIAGGVAIFESSSRMSATIATALGAVVIALEGLAIIGSIRSPQIRPQDIPRRNEPVELPGWTLPASFALVVAVLGLANHFFAG